MYCKYSYRHVEHRRVDLYIVSIATHMWSIVILTNIL